MLFHLDFRAEELAAAPQAELQECISEAVRAHRLGHHLMVINRQAADYILQNLHLNPLERTTITRLRSEYTQTADLVRRAKVHVRIAPLPHGTVRAFPRWVEFSIDQAIRASVFDKAMLIIEDEPNDGRFYTFLLENLQDVYNVPPSQCELVHGGGERSVHVAAARAAEGRVVCVIVDSDANAPASPEAAKFRTLRAIESDLNWPLVFVRSPPCREVENLIKLDLIAILDCAQMRGNELSVLRRIEDHETATGVVGTEAFLLYYDLKLGCDIGKLKQSLTAQELQWYTSKLSLVLRTEAEYSLGGFGTSIVAQVLRDNAARARLRAEIRKNAWRNVFGEFVEDLLWICVGGRRQFT